MDEVAIFKKELEDAQKILSRHSELLSANINLISNVMLDVIHSSATIEMNMEKIFWIYKKSSYAVNKKEVSSMLERIKNGDYVAIKKRNKLFRKIAIEVGVSDIDISVLRQLNDERDKIAHLQLRFDIDNNLPVINGYSRREGKVDIEALHDKYVTLRELALNELEKVYNAFGVKPIYWRGYHV